MAKKRVQTTFIPALSTLSEHYMNPSIGCQGERKRGVSIKISQEAMEKLEDIAHVLMRKKTPILGEIAECAINEVHENMEPMLSSAHGFNPEDPENV